jgi:predicted anti-sigma-YlaC factor YlaD
VLLQLRAALPRILALLAIVLGGTTAVAAIAGAVSGRSIAHALATGYYVVGAAILVGSFVLGSRGPWRSEVEDLNPDDWGGQPATFRARTRRRRRKATPEERAESKRGSFGLFLLGVALVLLGALVDPSRRAF